MKQYFFYGFLLSIPIYTWYKFYKEWKKLRDDYENHLLFTKRHNCTVMYRNSEVTGWPTPATESKLSVLSDKYEPILYFIRTSEVSLDIAVMLLNVQCIVDELLKAMKRNVKIRIITDYDCLRNSALKQLLNSGISVLCYVVPDPNYGSMFHFKYMVKDFTENTGYLNMGSLNWSVTSVIQNYENVNFISNHDVVKQFHNNFEETWRYIGNINSTNKFVKAKLKGLIHF